MTPEEEAQANEFYANPENQRVAPGVKGGRRKHLRKNCPDWSTCETHKGKK